MAFKIKTFKILMLILLMSCGEQNEEKETSNGSSSFQTDSLFTSWFLTTDYSGESPTGSNLDLTSGVYEQDFLVKSINVKVTQVLVDGLENAGKSNIPSVGSIYSCDFYAYFVKESSNDTGEGGSFILDRVDNTDTSKNNACLRLDNWCYDEFEDLDPFECYDSSEHSYSKVYINNDYWSLGIVYFVPISNGALLFEQLSYSLFGF